MASDLHNHQVVGSRLGDAVLPAPPSQLSELASLHRCLLQLPLSASRGCDSAERP